MKYPEDFINKIICGDCLDVMKSIPPEKIDLILTDPPYPDFNKQHGKEWPQIHINFLNAWDCQQLIFWPPSRMFPLNSTAIHIWHKPNGQSNEHYELIYERNGKKVYRVFRVPIINYKTLSEWTPHPAQKPMKLIEKLIEKNTDYGDLVLDPFVGSGTTAVACKLLHRNFIGIEINPDYCKIAEGRLAQGVL